jgi:hypothetical protein
MLNPAAGPEYLSSVGGPTVNAVPAPGLLSRRSIRLNVGSSMVVQDGRYGLWERF